MPHPDRDAADNDSYGGETFNEDALLDALMKEMGQKVD